MEHSSPALTARGGWGWGRKGSFFTAEIMNRKIGFLLYSFLDFDTAGIQAFSFLSFSSREMFAYQWGKNADLFWGG